MTSGESPTMLAAYAGLFGMWLISQHILIPVPFNLIATSTIILYIGCHRSLRLRDKEHPDAGQAETLSSSDAYKFPVFGSIVLFSLYVVFKYFDKDTINLILSIYFSVIGAFAMGATVEPMVGSFIRSEKRVGPKFTLPLVGEVDLSFTAAEALSLLGGVVFSLFYFKTKHWALNNIFGITFCVQAIERISVGSVKVGYILLIGLFFYDVFWVYGTPVMEGVAKNVDGPIKLVFVRAWADLSADPPKKMDASILGLGDIVVPGLFVSLLLRFDAEMAKADPKLAENARFKKPFFHAALVSYVLGLLATVAVMFYFKAAQPALFYLVPACLLSCTLTAWIRKDFTALWAYSEEEDEDGEAEKKDGDGSKGAANGGAAAKAVKSD